MGIGVRFLAQRFLFSVSIQKVFGSTQAPVRWDVRDFPRGLKLTTHFHLMSTLRLCGTVVHFHRVLKVCRVITHWNIRVKNTLDRWVGRGWRRCVCGCSTQIHSCKPTLFFLAPRMGRLKLLALIEILYPLWQP